MGSRIPENSEGGLERGAALRERSEAGLGVHVGEKRDFGKERDGPADLPRESHGAADEQELLRMIRGAGAEPQLVYDTRREHELVASGKIESDEARKLQRELVRVGVGEARGEHHVEAGVGAVGSVELSAQG